MNDACRYTGGACTRRGCAGTCQAMVLADDLRERLHADAINGAIKRIEVLAAPKVQTANPWKDAVLDELAICCMDAPMTESPSSILKRVIGWNVQIALDPDVSYEAQALIDKGRAQTAPPEGEGALTDSELLEFQAMHRVELTPEFEGPWDAKVYGESETPEAVFTGRTPREALTNAALSRSPAQAPQPLDDESLIESAVRSAIQQFGPERFARSLASMSREGVQTDGGKSNG